MKAVYVTQHGGPDQMVYGDLPEPKPGPHDVLIRLRAASINRVDLFAREGSHGVKRPFPLVGGRDAAGDVAQVGDCVTRCKPGDRVVALAATGCNAEYAVALQEDVWPLPASLSYEEASTLPTIFPTAWHMLVCRAKLQPGEDILIMAAGSGVGIAAIQIAKMAGARVFTTASTEEKLDKARALGADFTINYKRESVLRRIKELTDGKGVHVVQDHIGATVWEDCFESLRNGGRFISCGVSAGHRVQLHLGRLWTRDLSIMGTVMQPRDDMPKLLELFAQRKLKAVIHAVYPLIDAAEAHRVMEASSFFGKLVLKVA